MDKHPLTEGNASMLGDGVIQKGRSPPQNKPWTDTSCGEQANAHQKDLMGLAAVCTNIEASTYIN